MISISFPGGAGGNWLKSVIQHESHPIQVVNFHVHTTINLVSLTHETDPSKFDYLFSGETYFNFYLNVVYKLFHHDQNIFNVTDYKTHFLECVNTARFLCQFDCLRNKIYFNFDDLVDHPDQFYKKLLDFQTTNNFLPTKLNNFQMRRERFINTCVNPTNIYENFDNMIWVCFVIGQLMNHNIVPDNFVIYEKQHQKDCQRFAIQNYDRCELRKVHQFDTKIFFPNLI